MGAFTESVAIVTGAASGIGRAIAQRYAHDEARVVVSDVDEEGGEETVRLIREHGGEAVFIRADVSNPHRAKPPCTKPSWRTGGWTLPATTPESAASRT